MPRYTSEEVAEVYQRLGGSLTATARELGLSRGGVYWHVRKLRLKPVAAGQVRQSKVEKKSPPKKGVKRYLFTCAQNNTWVHPKVWENLLALRDYYEAELHVSTFTYNKNAWGKLSVKRDTGGEDADLWYDPSIDPYISDNRIDIAPGLAWCGEMNILPTARRPLSGFETYTGRKSGIFPHAKVAMESIASQQHESTKFNYTTGAITQMNYLQKTAGLKAEHHHCYGALVVEVDGAGRWFARQVTATNDGTMQDLDVLVTGGKVTSGNDVEGINWGDIHFDTLQPEIMGVNWSWPGSIFKKLRPRVQFINDLFHGTTVNHHARKDPHEQFRNLVEGRASVDEEVERCAEFLREISYTDHHECKTVVVDSNHDRWLERWLREHDYREDPFNAEFFLEAQLEKYRSIRKRNHEFHLLEWAVARHLALDSRIQFLRQDESYTICNGLIECGMHGDLGANGSRGTPVGISKLGKRANTGHTHSAGIYDGLFVAGTSGDLQMGYNHGPGSWSHSHVITYLTGKRCIVTVWYGKWRG